MDPVPNVNRAEVRNPGLEVTNKPLHVVHVTLFELLVTSQATSDFVSILQQQKHSRSFSHPCCLPYGNVPPTCPFPSPWTPFPVFFTHQLTSCSKVLPLLGRPTREALLSSGISPFALGTLQVHIFPSISVPANQQIMAYSPAWLIITVDDLELGDGLYF